MTEQQRFELLCEIGARAIIDGYYREAVSSFAAGLERFYEYAIRVIFSDDATRDVAELAKAWRHAQQSERQLGAFIFVWTYYFRTAPVTLQEDLTKKRNDVVHKGFIPDRKFAMEFGNAVVEVIKPLLTQLNANLPGGVEAVEVAHIHAARGDWGDDASIGPTIFPMLFDDQSVGFELYLKILKKQLQSSQRLLNNINTSSEETAPIKVSIPGFPVGVLRKQKREQGRIVRTNPKPPN